MALQNARIVGSGLIGTSIGLALSRSGISCAMVDSDGRSEKLSQDLVGPAREGAIDLVIFATPVGRLEELLNREFALNPQAGFIDVASVKTKSKVLVESSALPLPRFCPTHPMAGREVGGAESAQGDLFQGRPWIVDSSGVDQDVIELVDALIEICGGVRVEMDSHKHDQAVALISHLAQISSSLLAKQLLSAPESALEISGSGLRDTTRIAGSDPDLWSDIISSNADAILPLLETMSRDLNQLITAIDDVEKLRKFFIEGKNGRARIPGKHGGKAREYTYLPIVIEDKPGQLSLIFDACADVQVNIEDVSIEHSPGQEKGLITLAINPADAQKLSEHLTQEGWSVHPWRL